MTNETDAAKNRQIMEIIYYQHAADSLLCLDRMIKSISSVIISQIGTNLLSRNDFCLYITKHNSNLHLLSF